MTTHKAITSITRRSALAGLGIALATRRLGASAQVATPYPMTNHPIIGVWMVDNETRQPNTDVSYNIFSSEGTYAACSRDGNLIVVGQWRATGERIAELVDVLQEFDPEDMFAPDFAPEGNLFAPGSVVHRGVLEVDATGTKVTFATEVEFRDAAGSVTGTGEAESLGTRMAVVAEAAGTPAS
jgi:hypothetical protein